MTHSLAQPDWDIGVVLSAKRAPLDLGVRSFIGITASAEVSGIPEKRLRTWAGGLNGLPLPQPMILVDHKPGWPLPVMQAWRAGWRAESQMWAGRSWRIPHFRTAADLCELHTVTPPELAGRLRRGEVAAPVVWLDGNPGWCAHMGYEPRCWACVLGQRPAPNEPGSGPALPSTDEMEGR